MMYYIHNKYAGAIKYYHPKSEKELNEEKELKKKLEVQRTKGVKFSNKNFFRGK